MTRQEVLRSAVQRYESTKDSSKGHPPIDHHAIRAFWEGRAKAKWEFYQKAQTTSTQVLSSIKPRQLFHKSNTNCIR